MSFNLGSLGFGRMHGMRVQECFVPMIRVQARRHKRKSSRRWQKKWLKRFGTVEVPALSEEAQMRVVVNEGLGVIYAYPPAMKLIRERFELIADADVQSVERAREQIINGIIQPNAEDVRRYGKG